MFSRIETLSGKKFVGKCIQMSFSVNKTFELWKSFMPHRIEIPDKVGTELYSIDVYEHDFFNRFDPRKEFQKWAAVEVSDFENASERMETISVPEGLYSVFIHKGLPGESLKTYTHIFTEWLPNSDYILDNRPHFAFMGQKYKNNDPNSEEEIWIPITTRII